MKSVNELRRRSKKRRIQKKIKIFITLVILILILISNKLISNYINLGLDSKASINFVKAKDGEDTDLGKVKVILDPGHGGHDKGANFEYTYEKDITLSIAMEVGNILEGNDIEVIYTRDDDSALGDNEVEDLNKRVSISNYRNAEYFVSFHINNYDEYTYGYEDVYGFEVWTNNNDEKSLKLGQAIEEELEGLNYTERRPMLDGSEALYIIRENKNPSILVEFGFMNNDNDRKYFSDKFKQKLLATAVATSIIENIK